MKASRGLGSLEPLFAPDTRIQELDSGKGYKLFVSFIHCVFSSEPYLHNWELSELYLI